MMMPVSSSPNERSSRRSFPRRIDVSQSRSKCDFMEQFFSWSDTVFCRHHTSTGTIPFSKPDGKLNDDNMLEFVFENAESFTSCVPPSDGNGKSLLLPDDKNDNYNPNNEDHNSLFEQGQGQGQGRAVRQSSDHDLLDFCFDHVESLVCTEGNEASVLAAPILPKVSMVGFHRYSRKKRSLTTTTTIGNHRGTKITRKRRTTTTTTKAVDPTTPSTTKYYGLYQEGIVRAKTLKINTPKNMMSIVSC